MVTVTTSVEVDLSDVLDEASTKELEEELARRYRKQSRQNPDSLLVEAYQALMRGNAGEAALALERFLYPKFKSEVECLEQYKERKAA